VDRPDRMASAGASFGGYMMNWFPGQHDEVQDAGSATAACDNFDSMYASTEELWFDEWEHGGPPWGKNRGLLREALAAPARQELQDADAGDPQRPRLPRPGQRGHPAVTTLQRLGIPSRYHQLPRRGPLGAQSRATASTCTAKSSAGWRSTFPPAAADRAAGENALHRYPPDP